jgi:hypothetical protein
MEIAKKKSVAFLSRKTDLGIAVTLKSTIGLSTYLMEKIEYKYVMTARFNSDPIEVEEWKKLHNSIYLTHTI